MAGNKPKKYSVKNKNSGDSNTKQNANITSWILAPLYAVSNIFSSKKETSVLEQRRKTK